jgi:hypothetical protein
MKYYRSSTPIPLTGRDTASTTSPIPPLPWRQWCRASGLRPPYPKDLFQNPDAGTEGVTIAVDDQGQLPDQRFGLFVCQFKVHVPDIGNPEQR